MDVGAPAVVAAIHDATGVWIHDLPATPERILAALTARTDASAARDLASSSPPRRPRRIEDLPRRTATRSRCRSPDRPAAGLRSR